MTIKGVVGLFAALGFTLMMAGANLAHMTSQSVGAPVPVLGFDIPQRIIMAIEAACIDAAIIVCPFFLEEWQKRRRWVRFSVVVVMWGICSAFSVNNVHDWMTTTEARAADTAAKDEKRSLAIKENVEYERRRLRELRSKLEAKPDRDTIRVLNSQIREAQDSIDRYQKMDWENATARVTPTSERKAWGSAICLWILSVGSWFAFREGARDGGMGRWDASHPIPSHVPSQHPIPSHRPIPSHPTGTWDGINHISQELAPSHSASHPIPSHPTVPSHPVPPSQVGRQRPTPLPAGVVDIRAKLEGRHEDKISLEEALAMARRLRAMDPPTPWPEIAAITGWPKSTIHRRFSTG